MPSELFHFHRIIKHIPNVLTVMRLICSVILLFVKPLSALFFGLYIVCGASDALDGYIARKTKSTSQLGASIDSVADAIFIGVTLSVFLPILHLPLWILCWIGAVALIRIGSLIIGFVKYHALSFIHTYANKATGLMLFCFPFLYSIFGLTITSSLLCGLASFSAIEELIINIKSKELSRDTGCINWKRIKS
ncbi:CDP-diacylglycerol--glycerol-3-phosphate 3-phosphatidyltransferase [Paenibacillus sophorae]|uniref:CDP-alcohol phosphatidyltransferase family protein n=1 Tax=Paenibacillus sophorae TaxID=1333845 RepID=A0A1H8USE1_9BACL|nr:CDP-alcohol phosphatidyltransferase family protein [Paenibacillus sophorae]QWU15388.1 CDP-alcohol phosphatidyltransferase family protein [Paenibacillus sophorae]SEP06112.1 CDP-diacylglycerol--glycerol-3-phosphate 3-phosphatidyltransferase [Paenibacillus sophorae]